MGVHIHSGFTCSDASLVGGHYFAAGQTDPWKTVAYTSTSAGTGFFKVLMSAAAMGTTSASTAGRAFIIHNDAGGRIGCVLLGEKQAVTSGGDDGKDDKDDKEDKPKGDGDGKGKGDKSDKDDKPDEPQKPVNTLCAAAREGAKAFFGLTKEKAMEMAASERAGHCLALKSLNKEM